MSHTVSPLRRRLTKAVVICAVVLSITGTVLSSIATPFVSAQGVSGGASFLEGFEPNQTDAASGLAANAVGTTVLKDEPTFLQTLQIKAEDIWNRKWDILQDTLADIAAVAYRRGVSYLAQKLAYDTAVWIGSGGKGQGPLYITQGWEEYLGEAGDVASGLIFDDLIEKGWLSAGLCAPDFQVQLAIKTSFGQFVPPRPRCTFSRIRQNWDRAIQDADFLMEYSNSYAPGESSLSAALILNTNLIEETQKKVWRDTFSRIETSGFLSTTDIGGNIKLPGSAVAESLNGTLDFTLRQRDFPTGKIIADTVDTFAGTLVSTFLQNLMKCGLSCDSSSKNRRSGSLLDPNQSDAIEGISGAQVRLSRDLNQTFKPGGTYDILSKISQCSDANNPSPNGCAINNNMSTAIEQHLTVQQAIDKGLFPADQPFGFLVSGQRTAEPTLNGGIPYRSILIMRKYRIVPVGWELAARYIQQFGLEQKTLRDLVGLYNVTGSPYYHLVDPNWVLAAPEAYCNLQGPGPQIASQQLTEGLDVNSDGDFDDSGDRKPSIKVTRQDYCADEQTCLKVDDTGKCLNWGYCTEEKRVWNFGGNACKPEFNTCTSVDNRTNGSTASYLLSTVDFGTAPYACDAASAGCKQYSRQRNLLQTNATAADAWNNGAYPETVHLTAKTPDCDSSDAGCHAYIRSGVNLPGFTAKSNNLVQNPSFELAENNLTGGVFSWWADGREKVAAGWDAKPQVVINRGAVQINTNAALAGRTFTVSWHQKASSGSTDVKVVTPPCDTNCVGSTTHTNNPTGPYPTTTSWARKQLTVTFPAGTADTNFSVLFNMVTTPLATLQIDAAQVEESTTVTNFTAKPIGETVHLKKAPDSCTIPIACTADLDGDGAILGNDATVAAQWGLSNCSGETRWPCDDGAVQVDEVTAITSVVSGVINCDVPTCGAGDKFCAPSTNSLDNPPEPEQPQCQPYARYCLAEEVGCLGYTPQTGGAQITSVRGDVCPAQCVGYDVYTQSKTFFEAPKFQELIPATARRCSATQAGCDEFTNLDTEARGGEAREYYQQVRYCQKDTNGSAPFYSWEGSDTTGYQLRVFTLKETDVTAADADGSGTAYTEAQHGDAAKAPCTNISWTALDQAPACTDAALDVNGNLKLLSTICTADIARTNPDCRQFYDVNGSISYRLYSKTVSVTDNCQPYRKTESTETDCKASSGFWDTTINACFYQAVPTEGRRCSANAASCREYQGGTTANFRVVRNDTFEAGVNDWTNGTLSSVSSVVGGHSFATTSAYIANESIPVSLGSSTLGTGGQVNPGTYVLSFWARHSVGPTNAWVRAQFIRPDLSNIIEVIPQNTPLTAEWQLYQSEPFTLSGFQDLQQAILSVSFNQAVVQGTLFVDNIQIKTNVSSYYLIKNSWNTPSACKVGTKKMLGCQNYRVSDGATRSIYSFGQACSPKVIGCEALIDTQNTTIGDDAGQLKNFAGGSGLGGVTVPADAVDYLVNDPAKRCNGKFQGCEALGVSIRQSITQADPSGWQPQPVYKLNNPDRYEGNYLCNAAQRECAEYRDSNGSPLYFKDPGQNVCEYRSDKPEAGWYRRSSTANSPDCQALCASNAPANAGKACTSNADCGGATCVPAPRRTNSPGGVAEPADPQFGLAASCALAEDSCREFLDPRSDDGKNMLSNGSFVITGTGSSWTATVTGPTGFAIDSGLGVAVGSAGAFYQSGLELVAKTNYILSAEVQRINGATGGAFLQVQCGGTVAAPAVRYPTQAVPFVPTTNGIFERFSTQFTSSVGQTDCRFFLGLHPSTTGELQFRNVSMRPASYYYQLANNIDRNSCNGSVNNADCVLVKEQGKNLDKLGVRPAIYDADLSPQTSSSAPYTTLRSEYTCDTATNACVQDTSISCTSHKDCQLNYDANAIVKVRPDRACAAWLATRDSQVIRDSSGKEQRISLAVGNCEEFDSANVGRCIRWAPDSGAKNLTFSSATVDQIKNLSGFSKVGFSWLGVGTIEGNLSPAHMAQEANSADLANGSFEQATGSGNPIGWLGWDNGRNFKVISDPITAQKAGVRYPREGRRILEVNANTDVATLDVTPWIRNISGLIPVAGGNTYALSADINTQRFTGPDVVIRVAEFEPDGDEISTARRNIITLGPGKDWTQKSGSVKVGSGTAFIRFQLAWVSSGSLSRSDGRWYVDNIQLGRALTVQTGPDVNAAQSCRIYPADDSLSCRYTDSEGLRQRGKLGYCLEWDPQHLDVCLQWYPVDNVVGDGINDPVGYSDRGPLYICAQAQAELVNPNLPSQVPYVVSTHNNRRINNGQINGGTVVTGENDTITNFLAGSSPFEATSEQKSLGYPEAVCLGPAISLSSGGSHAWCKRSHNFPYCSRSFCITAEDALRSEDDGIYRTPKNLSDDYAPEKPLPGINDSEYEIWSLHKAMVREGYAAPLIERSGNIYEFWVLIDRETRSIARFMHYTIDDNNNTSDFYFPEGIRILRSRCEYVANVVSPEGGNAAWNKRVASNSRYIVPVLGYGYDADYQPFGGVVAPSPVDNPVDWDASTAQFNQPLVKQPPNAADFSAPFQARAGSPYACNIPATETGFACTSPDGYPISANKPFCGTIRDQVTGLNQGNCSGSNQACLSGSQCTSNYCLGSFDDNDDGVVNGSDNGVVQTCSTDAQCGSFVAGNHCEGNHQKTCNPANDTYAVVMRCSLNQLKVCDNDSTNDATGGLPSCDLGEGSCEGTDVELQSGDCFAEGSGACVPDNTCIRALCTFDKYCFRENGFTDQVCTDNAECNVPAVTERVGSVTLDDGLGIIKRLFTRTYGLWKWVGDYFSGQYQVYNQSPSVDLKPPTLACSGGVRPVTDLVGDTDYCGIYPVVSNITVFPTTLISGTGEITLSFQATADGEQEPIKEIYIDWGDGKKIRQAGLKLQSRVSPDTALKFTHVYSIREVSTCSANGSCDVAPVCDTVGCTFKPRIRIVDNWDWCNGETSGASGITACANSWKSGPTLTVRFP